MFLYYHQAYSDDLVIVKRQLDASEYFLENVP